MPIIAIESDTDHIRSPTARVHWAAESLKRLDVERKSYLADSRDDILVVCREIISRYDEPVGDGDRNVD